MLPEHVIAGIESGLKSHQLVPADAQATIERSLPHGHVAAVAGQAAALGLPAMLGPASPAWDLVMALIIARVCRPGSKLAMTRWWQDTTLAADLGVATLSTGRLYAAMDWLAAYLVWHLRKAWVPLAFTDENQPDPVDPVAPAKRSSAAGHKASTQTTSNGAPAHSFISLLGHLATLTHSDIRYGTDCPACWNWSKRP